MAVKITRKWGARALRQRPPKGRGSQGGQAHHPEPGDGIPAHRVQRARAPGQVGGKPLAKVRALKYDETEMAYLDVDKILKLLQALDGVSAKVVVVARVCLATGAPRRDEWVLSADQYCSDWAS